MPLSLDTPVSELYQAKIARLGQTTAQKLAAAVAGQVSNKTPAEVTVEDLLMYLPMRYEDRSNLTRIADLEEGKEASLELYTKTAAGYEVRNRRSFGRSHLFIFEVTATDA